MRPISATRSVLTSALAGAGVVALVLVLTAFVSLREHDLWSVSFRAGALAIDRKFPAFIGELVAGPVVLILTFLVFLAIGRRAARPIEVARRQQLHFTADASHELRTPLTLIEGEASLALGRRRRPEEYRQSLERIGAESRRMRKLVEDLLWLSRSDSDPERPAVEKNDLRKVTAAAAERFSAMAEARGQILSAEESGPEPLLVSAPSEWMERLLGVLLDNAVRYTPAGGRIRLATATTTTHISVAVEDSGPGIPDDEKAAIFQRFHRAIRTQGGTGLGLAIADRVVRRTGGAWKVGRSPLGGASFEVRWHRRPASRRSWRAAFRELSGSNS